MQVGAPLGHQGFVGHQRVAGLGAAAPARLRRASSHDSISNGHARESRIERRRKRPLPATLLKVSLRARNRRLTATLMSVALCALVDLVSLRLSGALRGPQAKTRAEMRRISLLFCRSSAQQPSAKIIGGLDTEVCRTTKNARSYLAPRTGL